MGGLVNPHQLQLSYAFSTILWGQVRVVGHGLNGAHRWPGWSLAKCFPFWHKGALSNFAARYLLPPTYTRVQGNRMIMKLRDCGMVHCKMWHLFCFLTFVNIKIPSHTLPPTPSYKHSLKSEKSATEHTFQVPEWWREEQVWGWSIFWHCLPRQRGVPPWGQPVQWLHHGQVSFFSRLLSKRLGIFMFISKQSYFIR